MNAREAAVHEMVHDVMKHFPGAQLVQVRDLTPPDDAESSSKLQIGDLLRYAERERDRAASTAKTSESAGVAADQARAAEAFGKIADLIVHVRDNSDVRASLAHAARKAALDAAERTKATQSAAVTENAP